MSNKEYLGKYIYSVETDGEGKKSIHVHSYYYQEDGPIQCVEFTWLYCPISIKPKDRMDYIEEHESKVTQYQGDVEHLSQERYSGEPLSNLPHKFISEVDENTPDGTYIDMI